MPEAVDYRGLTGSRAAPATFLRGFATAIGAAISIYFVIVAFCIFMIVKLINSARRQPAPEPEVPPAPTRDQTLLMEIRDAIQTKGV